MCLLDQGGVCDVRDRRGRSRPAQGMRPLYIQDMEEKINVRYTLQQVVTSPLTSRIEFILLASLPPLNFKTEKETVLHSSLKSSSTEATYNGSTMLISERNLNK